MERIERLAHLLSVGGARKRVSFEPDTYPCQKPAEFADSPVCRSRFFDATGIASTSFAFVQTPNEIQLAHVGCSDSRRSATARSIGEI
jgi:hypothetical protein